MCCTVSIVSILSEMLKHVGFQIRTGIHNGIQLRTPFHFQWCITDMYHCTEAAFHGINGVFSFMNEVEAVGQERGLPDQESNLGNSPINIVPYRPSCTVSS